MALKFTRNGDYTDDEANSASGRALVKPGTLDGEMDELLLVTDDHADLLDLVLRGDNYLSDNYLQGHEFSSTAVAVIKGLLNSLSALNYRLDWVGGGSPTAYLIGDLVTESGNVYFCLVAHTSGTFSTDLAANKWFLFVQKGSGAAFPGSPAADDLLSSDGANEVWGKLTAAMAPLHALLASPAFTGLLSVVGVKTGKIAKTSGATISLDFNAGPNQDVAALGVNTTFSTANRAASSGEVKFLDVRVVSDGGGAYSLTFPSSPAWVWLTTIPGTLASGKTGLLSLRSYGSADSDIIAAWVVEA